MSGFDNEVVFSTGERLEISSAQAIAIMQNVSTDVSRINYNATPEGAVAANPSSFCHDRVAGNVYIKQTGTGNTGWVQINTGTPPPLIVVYAWSNGGMSNVTGDGTTFTPIMDSTFVNVGSHYDTTTGIFTSPSTANYLYTVQLSLRGLTVANNRSYLVSVLNGVSNYQDTFLNIGSVYSVADDYGVITQTAIAPMVTNGTLNFTCTVYGGTKTVSMGGLGTNGIVSSFSITQLR